jgi:hypothetical protein
MVTCPNCELEVRLKSFTRPDGDGIRDGRGRVWHRACAANVLASFDAVELETKLGDALISVTRMNETLATVHESLVKMREHLAEKIAKAEVECRRHHVLGD